MNIFSRMYTTLKLQLFLVVLCIANANAQVPQLLNYQGIARDAKGNPLSDRKLNLKIAILPSADAVVPEYEEVQSVITNAFGLYTLQIGSGNPLSGQMQLVKWETGNKYINIAIDPNGGDQYTNAGTTQLLSVPYALYAARSGNKEGDEDEKARTGSVSSANNHLAGDVNFLSKFTAFNVIGKSQVFDNGTSVGIGTVAPAAGSKLHLLTTNGNIEHLRMQNTSPTGFGKFLMYNDVNYATFTKYGSAYPGGYPGVASQFPYAHLLAFGNNLGGFLLSNNGNVGIGMIIGGSTSLKFNAVQTTGYLGLGGSNVPASNVHFNTSLPGDTLQITNATTGHLKTDGLQISNTGNAASVINRENSTLSLGTNNNTQINMTADGNTGFNGQVKIVPLSGSPKRPVYADTDGTLITDTVISYTATAPGGLPASIADVSCSALSSSITISGAPLSVMSKNISVAVTIMHSYMGDIEMYLCSPMGDTLELCNDQGFSGNNFENTIFSDYGDGIIPNTDDAPFSKIYKPKGGLTANACGVAGELNSFSDMGGGNVNPNGIWTLLLRDDQGADTGSLVSWNITFDGAHPDNFIPKWKSGTLSAKSQLYDNDKNVGIGTLAPLAKLHVYDGLIVSGKRDAGDTLVKMGPGARMLFNAHKAAFRAGDITNTNVAWDPVNIGEGSAALNLNTRAAGNYSFATGAGTHATGTASSVFGNFSSANAFCSAAFGLSTISNGYVSMVVGQYNDTLTAVQPGIQVSTPLFIVGNGTDDVNRSNAMVVRYDGRVGIGTNTPSSTLHVNGEVRIGSAETLADSGANMMALNASFIPSGDNLSSQTLGKAAHRWHTVYAGNGVINTSDARDKTDIAEIPYGLSALMQLKPVHFRWKQNPDEGYKLGFLAQDLKAILPEVVSDKEFVLTNEKTGEGEWRETNRMGVYYSDMIPVLTRAMQEQQNTIELLKLQLDELQKRLEAVEKK